MKLDSKKKKLCVFLNMPNGNHEGCVRHSVLVVEAPVDIQETVITRLQNMSAATSAFRSVSADFRGRRRISAVLRSIIEDLPATDVEIISECPLNHHRMVMWERLADLEKAIPGRTILNFVEMDCWSDRTLFGYIA